MIKIFFICLLCISNKLLSQFEIPNGLSNDSIYFHNAYAFSFNWKYRQANWVAYQLTRDETKAKYTRKIILLQTP